ncbi:hypothetical protein ACS0TY_026129 [Phlomoides rotata]
MESLLENLNLSVEDELIIGVDSNSDGGGDINLCLSQLAAVWNPKRGVMIKQIEGGRMLIQFNHRLDYKRLVDGGPWTIGNHSLILHQLQIGEVPLQVPLDFLPFWVQIYDLPLGSFSESVGHSLGNFIGRFLEYDTSNRGAAWRTFMRIRVELDVKQPLKRFKKIRMGNGSSMVVNFKYERLYLFYFVCGRLGHSESFYDDLFNSNDGDVKKEWGSFLREPDRRGSTGGGGRWLRHACDDSGGVGKESMMGKDANGNPAVRGMGMEGGVNQGDQTDDEAGLGENLQNINSMHGVTAHSGAIIINPIFESHVGQGDGDNYDVLIGEVKKRKRAMILHGSVGDDNTGGHGENKGSNAQEHALDGTQLFLSAGPSVGACLEL